VTTTTTTTRHSFVPAFFRVDVRFFAGASPPPSGCPGTAFMSSGGSIMLFETLSNANRSRSTSPMSTSSSSSSPSDAASYSSNSPPSRFA